MSVSKQYEYTFIVGIHFCTNLTIYFFILVTQMVPVLPNFHLFWATGLTANKKIVIGKC